MRAKVEEIVESTSGKLVKGDAESVVSGVSTDTRSISEGDLYVALEGPNFDGNKFAEGAVESKAGALLLREGHPDISGTVERLPDEAAVVLHPAPREALGMLASWHRSRLDVPVIGITGSCGKTTTKNVLVHLLGTSRKVVGSPNSFNNEIGVPHTLFLADESTETLVVELGTNAPGEIAALCRIANPTGAIITNIGAAHLEGLGTKEGVAREKGDLAAKLTPEGFCVLNANCPFTPEISSRTSARVITFSVEGDGDLDATDLYTHGAGTTFRLDGREVTSPLVGAHNVENLLAALAACRGMGLDLDEVLPMVSGVRAARGRMERIEVGDLVILDDSYNANPTSAMASVRVLEGMHGHQRRVLVLGEMLELGEHSDPAHKAIGADAAQRKVDLLICVGELAKATAAGALEAGLANEAVLHFKTAADLVDACDGLFLGGDVILVKGSRGVGLECLVQHLSSVHEGGGAL
ncbi:MAG: UDP-N-acetylmuramoyl-tripeptide--D-alanyl-D-alanine ligase [Planctomycetota bacterium]|jgi:UDP-N-acetylmuramoyl-tripeptide--D-alanyl-D-alanine ligase|nr:UDP-N-acetylmuramoyl-tripeptide--D-alanyl-D-alanine ligase [Planctomycetota bacterium]